MEIGSLLFGHLLTDEVLGQGSCGCSKNNGVRGLFNTVTRFHPDDVVQLQSGWGPGGS